MNLKPWPKHYLPPRMAHRSDYLERAALVLGVTIDEIRKKKCHRVSAHRRFAIAHVMKDKLNYSYPLIGKALDLNHSTVIHGVRKSRLMIIENSRHAAIVKALEMVA
ncbi:helix-turn-helix domain-containing protein [Parasphingorhabdus sp.]|uniref:helix-turn-helix domain-containing protein n=1 Tax=Parasphingorhabdus sp. TaxID=2709688 RepID=UPI003A92152C